MGPRMRIQANAENTSGPHDETPHGGGRPPCGSVWDGRRPPHIMCSSGIFSIGLRFNFRLWPILYFQLWPRIAFSGLTPYCIFSFRPILYFQLWPHIVFSASPLYCIEFQGPFGPKINVFAASLKYFTVHFTLCPAGPHILWRSVFPSPRAVGHP